MLVMGIIMVVLDKDGSWFEGILQVKTSESLRALDQGTSGTSYCWQKILLVRSDHSELFCLCC